MAESDSILQLGIEAAREGNKDEARNLFRLLTRQEPENAQAWLWLAGVAESREERQTALEHVIELEPDNEMAASGLQALGVSPASQQQEEEVAPPISSPELNEDVRDPYNLDDDDPFAELDSLSDAMNESPEAVRRSEDDASQSNVYSDPDQVDERIDPDYDSSSERSFRRQAGMYDEDEETEPARGVNPLLLGFVVLAFIVLLGVFFWPQISGLAGLDPGNGNVVDVEETDAGTGVDTPSGQDEGGAENTPGGADPNAPPAGEQPAPGEGDPGAPPEGEQPAPGEGDPGAPPEGEQPAPGEGDPGAPPEGEQPAPGGADPGAPPEGEPAPPVDLANADPAIIDPGTPLESNGWQYNFSQPSYATSFVGGLGDVQPQGRFVVILVLITNQTGQAQAIPADFFVLKDAQGRVYMPQPQASTAYLNLYGRGLAADLSQEDAVPSDTLVRSVPIIFDVAPDATELEFFASSNPDQGWLVLSSL